MDLDKVLQHVGPVGLWQYLHVSLLFLVAVCSGIGVVTFAFTGFVPKYRCAIPQCEDPSNTSYFNHEVTPFHSETNLSHYSFVKVAIGNLDPNEMNVDKLARTCKRRVVTFKVRSL